MRGGAGGIYHDKMFNREGEDKTKSLAKED